MSYRITSADEDHLILSFGRLYPVLAWIITLIGILLLIPGLLVAVFDWSQKASEQASLSPFLAGFGIFLTAAGRLMKSYRKVYPENWIFDRKTAICYMKARGEKDPVALFPFSDIEHTDIYLDNERGSTLYVRLKDGSCWDLITSGRSHSPAIAEALTRIRDFAAGSTGAPVPPISAELPPAFQKDDAEGTITWRAAEKKMAWITVLLLYGFALCFLSFLLPLTVVYPVMFAGLLSVPFFAIPLSRRWYRLKVSSEMIELRKGFGSFRGEGKRGRFMKLSDVVSVIYSFDNLQGLYQNLLILDQSSFDFYRNFRGRTVELSEVPTLLKNFLRTFRIYFNRVPIPVMLAIRDTVRRYIEEKGEQK